MSDYVLSDRETEELERLEFQHEVWRPETNDLLNRAGIGEGTRVVDLGCGPGFLTIELARRVGERGGVIAVDKSELFVAHLRRLLVELNLPNVSTQHADVMEWELAESDADAVVCRWLLMFLPEPETVVRRAWNALRPGGVLAVIDYHPFLDISLTPRVEAFDRVYRAVARLIESFGGDADVGGRVPEMMRAAGFTRIDIHPVSRSDVPGSPLWEWIVRTGRNHGNLVEHGLLSAEELDEYHAAVERAESDHEVTFTAPTVQSIVGWK